MAIREFDGELDSPSTVKEFTGELDAPSAPEMRAYEPNIFEKARDFLGITERRAEGRKAAATTELVAREHGLTTGELAEKVGGTPSLYAPISVTPIDVAQDVTTAAKHMGWEAGLKSLLAGNDPKAIAEDSKLLEEQKKKDREFAAYSGSGASYPFGLSSEKVASSVQSLPFSMYTQAAYLVGAAPGLVARMPAMAHAGGAALSAPVAYRMDAANVLTELHSAANDEFKKQAGRDMTPDEFAEFASDDDIQWAVRKHALAEAGFESLGNFLTSKAFGGALKGVLKKAGADVTEAVIAKDIAPFAIAKAGAKSVAGELATETPTQMVQARQEQALGLQAGEAPDYTNVSDWGKAFDEVFWPTVLMSGTLAAGTKAVGGVSEAIADRRLAGKVKAFVDAADLSQLSDEQFSNVQSATERAGNRLDPAAKGKVRAETQRRKDPVGAAIADADKILEGEPADPFSQQLAEQGAERQARINEAMPSTGQTFQMKPSAQREVYPTGPVRVPWADVPSEETPEVTAQPPAPTDIEGRIVPGAAPTADIINQAVGVRETPKGRLKDIEAALNEPIGKGIGEGGVERTITAADYYGIREGHPEFPVTVNPGGSIMVGGDPGALRETLAGAGVTVKGIQGKRGVSFPPKHAKAVQAALEASAPSQAEAAPEAPGVQQAIIPAPTVAPVTAAQPIAAPTVKESLPAQFPITESPKGEITVQGDSEAIRTVLRSAGITTPGVKSKTGLTFGKSQAEEVKMALVPRERRQAAESVAEEQRKGERRVSGKARALYERMSKDELIRALLHHELTGIKGKRAFVVELEDAAHVISVDADSLKWVNDNMSPDSGDRLLHVTADALVEEFGYESAYHTSGDEFYVLLGPKDDLEVAKEAMARVENRVKASIISVDRLDGSKVTVKDITATPGYGKNKEEADYDLKREKKAREASGKRAGRGEQPRGAVITPAPAGEQGGIGEDAANRAPDLPRTESARVQVAPQQTPAPAGVSVSEADENRAHTILDAAGIVGMDRISLMRDFREGRITVKDLEKSFPAKKEAVAEQAAKAPEASTEAEQQSRAREKEVSSLQLEGGSKGQAEYAAVEEAIEGKSANEVIDWLADNAPSEDYRLIAKAAGDKLRKIQGIGGRVRFYVAHNGDEIPSALYVGRGIAVLEARSDNVDIWVNGSDVEGKEGTSYETVLHEFVHAATMATIADGLSGRSTSARVAVDKLRGVANAIGAHLQTRREVYQRDPASVSRFESGIFARKNNATSDLSELVAWAFTNRDMQVYLEGVPYQSGSLWTRFVDAIRSALGLSPRSNTALSEVLKAGEELIADDPLAMVLDTTKQKPAPQFARDHTITTGPGVRKSEAQNNAPGLSRPAAISTFKRQFPGLATALDKLIDRGDKGQKGGLILIESLDEAQRTLAEKTGREQFTEIGDGEGILGLYDPKSGMVAAILPNIDEVSFPGVVLHEFYHASNMDEVNLRAVQMVAGRGLQPQKMKAFLERVKSHIDDVDASFDPREYAPYIIQKAVEEGRQAGFSAIDSKFMEWVDATLGKGVGNLIRDFVTNVRAFLFKRGIGIKAGALTVDDMIALAKAGMKAAASGEAVTQRGEAEFARAAKKEETAGDSGRDYTQEQKEAFKNTGRTVEVPTWKQRAELILGNASMKLRQGIADQFAPIADLDPHAYTLARLSKGADGALEAFMLHGQLKLVDGVYDADMSGGVIDKLLKPLKGEMDDFMWWVAANRAERLMAEGKEHLFTEDDIKAYKSLALGKSDFDYTLQHSTGPYRAGTVTRDRAIIYRDAAKTLEALNKNVMDIAEQSGLIDGDSRKIWEQEFYVPFYRAMEEGVGGPNIKAGLVRQYAFKQLKGGTNKLNQDLLANTIQNWAHLVSASAKNRAARSTLEAADKAGIAHRIPYGEMKPKKGVVYFLGATDKPIPKGQKYTENGVEKVSDGTATIREHGEVSYLVDDPFLLDAVTAIEFNGFGGPLMKAMGKFKYFLTLGVTANPTFKIRNLIRDSISAIGQSDLSVNPLTNIRQGFKASSKETQTYVSMLASGGIVKFGTMLEGNRAEHVRWLKDKGVAEATILDSDQKLKAFWRGYIKPAIDAYNDLGDRGESINRAALYEQMRARGMSHAEASLAARDLLDFSMGGTWSAVRLLTQTVPFMNARIQGLYKLGRSEKKRLGYVVGAVSLASLALLAAYGDDDDWKQREDWDRDSYWWFKFGGVAFRIPKPFEIGAIGTLAERSAELFFDNEMTGERYIERIGHLVGDQLAMNPIPQIVKPILDVYANKDSFTGRPIETMGMDRLLPEDRYTARTSEIAKLVGKTDFLSPVQADHLIRGYLGWLGTATTTVVDYLSRATVVDVPPPPSMKLKDAFMAGNFVETLPANSSRYVSQMYEQSKEIEQVYASFKHYQALGQIEKAQELIEERGEDLAKFPLVAKVKKIESDINRAIRQIEASEDLSKEEKRDLLDELYGKRDWAARQLAAQ